MNARDKRHWLDDPRHVTWLVRALAVVCLALLLADPFYDKHPHFAWEGWFGFYAWFGFLCFVVIVLSGWPLRKLLSRDEDYYDR